MYEEFFGFSDRPFNAAPIAKRYCAVGPIEAARASLTRSIERAEGIGLLIGPAGTGKTLLCQVLADQFRGRFAVAHLASGRLCTRRHLFQTILHELGLPYRGLEEGEMGLALADFATNSQPHSQGILLIVDEAHTLPARLLDEARLLTNIARGGESRVRLVLSASAALEERLANPKMESFNQRIATRCYLQSLAHDETLNYIRGAIGGVNGDWRSVFTENALNAVHRATDGIPRLINQVCDHALMLALAGGVHQIDKAGIEESWADLQQLPTPWNVAGGASEPARDIIEFGSLDDDMPIAAKIGDHHEAPEIHEFDPPDELELFYGEPTQRLDKIEERLENIDRPPVVSEIRRNVEQKPRGPHDVFGDSFDEEEVVIDRFAAMTANPLASRPMVHSAEGREYSTILTPLIADAKPTDDEHRMSIESADDFVDRAMTIAMPVRTDGDPVMPEEYAANSAIMESPAGGDNRSAEPFDALEGMESFEHGRQVHSTTSAAPLGASADLASGRRNEVESDLIVIEDDPAPPTPLKPNSGVKKQEYRQLFARLRRG